MKIVVCVKEVPDPDTINAYAVGGQLDVDEQTFEIRGVGIPSLMNAYDEQAIEAAVRLRDAGVDCSIHVLTLGARQPEPLFTRAFALGADDGYAVETGGVARLGSYATTRILARALAHLGGADLVLCGRQASDHDQGSVPVGVATLLALPFVGLARALRVAGSTLAVTRVLLDGEEDVEVALPALVTVTSELGAVRYPTLRDTLAAKRKKFTRIPAAELGVDVAALAAADLPVIGLAIARAVRRAEFIDGPTAAEKARVLASRLRDDGLL